MGRIDYGPSWSFIVSSFFAEFERGRRRTDKTYHTDRDTHILLRYRDLHHGFPGIYHTDRVARNRRSHAVRRRFDIRTYEPFYVLPRIHGTEAQSLFYEFMNTAKFMTIRVAFILGWPLILHCRSL